MKMLKLDRIIVEHARRPRENHTWFIVFLLGTILFCTVVIVLQAGK